MVARGDLARVKGWDPRQGGPGASLVPIFDVPCRGPDGFTDVVLAMSTVGSSGRNGARDLLTGALPHTWEHPQM